jgi:hypothetical protein
MTRPLDLAGQTFGRLTAVERVENDEHGNARWHCRCACGETAASVRCRDLRNGNTGSCGCLQRSRASEANKKPDDQITYGAAHDRVERARGSASTYVCVDCWRQAAHWSLRHEALVTHLGESPNGYACKYSGNPSDYEPRCAPCHVKYDSRGALE